MPNPEPFCEFHTQWNPKYQKFHCMLGDWQCRNPICSYGAKSQLPERGCGIANHEGKRAKYCLGILGALANEGLLPGQEGAQ